MQCSALLGYSQSLVTGCSERLCNSIFCCRILVGVSNGIVSTSIFTVEICSPELRGTFSMLESVLRCDLQESAELQQLTVITAGVLAASWSSVWAHSSGGGRSPACVPWCPSWHSCSPCAPWCRSLQSSGPNLHDHLTSHPANMSWAGPRSNLLASEIQIDLIRIGSD